MEAAALVAGIKIVEKELEAGHALVHVLRCVVHAVIVIKQRAHGFVDVAIRRVSGSETGLLQGVVVVEVLSAEEVAAWAAIAFRSCVEIVQVSGDFRHAEPAILVLRRQFIESANHDRLLVAGYNRRPGCDCHITRISAALIKAPDGLGGNIGVRSDAEIRIGTHPLDEVVLHRILSEELKAVRPGPQGAVELTAALEWKLVYRVDRIIWEFLRGRSQAGICQRALRQYRRDW